MKIQDIYKKLFDKAWPKWVGGVLLGVLNILFFLYLMPLGGIFPAMADWGLWTYKLAGINVQAPWGSPELLHKSVRGMIVAGLVLGSLAGALLSREFRFKKDTTGAYLKSFFGGALMGIGSFLAGACIIGGFYSAVMALSLSGFYMMIGLILGAYIGGKVMLRQGHKKAEKISCNVGTSDGRECKSNQPVIGVFVISILLAAVIIYFLNGNKFFGIIVLFGAAFGMVFQRAAFGFSGAFKDVFTAKNNDTMKAILISLIIGVLGFTAIKARGLQPADMFVMPAGWSTIAGGLIFGFGMVFADG